jgi:hypothetical protein
MRSRLLFVPLVAIAIASCAPSICKRKESFFRNHCQGVLAYDGDPMCEKFTEKCNDQQIAAGEAYVGCLEALPQCSQEAVSQCASMHPNGVNLMCLQ